MLALVSLLSVVFFVMSLVLGFKLKDSRKDLLVVKEQRYFSNNDAENSHKKAAQLSSSLETVEIERDQLKENLTITAEQQRHFKQAVSSKKLIDDIVNLETLFMTVNRKTERAEMLRLRQNLVEIFLAVHGEDRGKLVKVSKLTIDDIKKRLGDQDIDLSVFLVLFPSK